MVVRGMQHCATKLKQIINKCNALYLICKNCNEMNVEESDEKVIEESNDVENNKSQEHPDLLNSLKSMLDKQVTQIESKLENLIDAKLEN